MTTLLADLPAVESSHPRTPILWRWMTSPPARGAFNMALDEVLMRRAVAEDCWILRTYSWARPTVSFGRNQSAARDYDAAAIRAAGFDVVRRPTGGRAILHHREITYSVAAPLTGAGALRDAYVEINQLLRSALVSLGVPAEMSAEHHRMPPGLTPCFAFPSHGELVARGRKLAGSAQWRSPDAFLQHGSILIDDEQQQLRTLLKPGLAAPDVPRAATLRELVDPLPDAPMLVEALCAAIVSQGDVVEPLDPGSSTHDAEALAARHYDDEIWTWRR